MNDYLLLYVTFNTDYSGFDVFSPNFAAQLREQTGINDHPIDLRDDKAGRVEDLRGN